MSASRWTHESKHTGLPVRFVSEDKGVVTVEVTWSVSPKKIGSTEFYANYTTIEER